MYIIINEETSGYFSDLGGVCVSERGRNNLQEFQWCCSRNAINVAVCLVALLVASAVPKYHAAITSYFFE